MARTNTTKNKLPKHDTGDLNWGNDFNEGLDVLDAHTQRETLRPPRTLTAILGSGAVGANLVGSTTYFYKVTAINSVGETTEEQIPAVVEAAVTQGATPVPVILEWEAVDGATGYRIYKATSSGGEEFLLEKTGGATVTHTDDGNTAVTGGQNVPVGNTARASVTGIRKTGEAAPLRGDVKLKPGANVTLTQLPGTNELEIAAAAGGGQSPFTAVVEIPTGVAATDTANIQAALDSIGAGGGTVVLREGTYVLNAALNIKKRTTVIGQGGLGRGSLFGGTVVNAGAGGLHFKLPTGVNEATDIVFMDMVWKGSKSTGQTYIDDSVVSGGPRGIHFIRIAWQGQIPRLGNVTAAWTEVFFRNCYFDPPSGTMEFGDFGSISVQNWVFDGCWFRTASVVIQGGNGTEGQGGNHLVTGCLFDGGGGNEMLRIKSFFTTVDGNYFRANLASAVDAIHVERSGNVISNNLVINSQAGAKQITLGGLSDNNVVVGNKCDSIILANGSGGNVVRGNKAAITDSSTQTDNKFDSEQLATAKGDLLASPAAGSLDNLPVGTDGQVLTADSVETLGVKWATPAGGGGYATAIVDAPTGVAATDTAAVLAAFNSLPAGGGKVLFREGTYLLNQLTVTKDNVHFQGQGRAETILQANGGAILFVLDGRNDLTFSDFKCLRTAAGGNFFQAGAGIYNRIVWRDLNFDMNVTSESVCIQMTGFQKTDCSVENCHFKFASDGGASSKCHGIRSGGWLRLRIADNAIDYSGMGGTTITSFGGFFTGILEDCTVVGNTCVGDKFQFFIQTNLLRSTVSGNVIRKNQDAVADFNSGFAFLITGGGSSVIANNYVAVNSTATSFNRGACMLIDNVSGMVITGNKLVPSGNALGVWLGRTTASSPNNVISGNDAASIELDSGAGTTGNVIVGNKATVTDNSGGVNTIASNG